MPETTNRMRPSWMTPFGSEGMGDVFFDRLWPEWPSAAREDNWVPMLDLFEREGKYFVKMELPGVPKDTISVNIRRGILAISGTKPCKDEVEDVAYYARECRYGAFARAVRLPVGVDEQKVAAQYKDGVLMVELPMMQGVEVKKIEIKPE